MPENQFNLQEQQELFTFTEDGESSVEKAVELLKHGIKDEVLIKLVQKHENIFVSIEDQGSLLEDKPEEHLTGDEEKEAMDEYELEIRPPPPPSLTQPYNQNLNQNFNQNLLQNQNQNLNLNLNYNANQNLLQYQQYQNNLQNQQQIQNQNKAILSNSNYIAQVCTFCINSILSTHSFYTPRPHSKNLPFFPIFYSLLSFFPVIILFAFHFLLSFLHFVFSLHFLRSFLFPLLSSFLNFTL